MSGRKPGDTNFSDRERKYLAEIDHLKAKLAAEKANGKVKDAKLNETSNKLRDALKEAKKKK